MEYLSLNDARSWIDGIARLIAENSKALSELDAAIGDGDHGENMHRGFNAVVKKLETAQVPDISALFKLVGMTLLSTVGGAAGPLYGGFFLALARTTAGKDKLPKGELLHALSEGLADIQRRGKANLGDKTMVDSLTPALKAFEAAPDADITKATRSAAETAAKAAEATIPLLALKGRASYLGERSIGHQDPGATSASLVLQALASVCNLVHAGA
jgi:phosphoenolpyruvate---glycerone phosphotransferase subunit DhaL